MESRGFEFCERRSVLLPLRLLRGELDAEYSAGAAGGRDGD